MGSPKYACSDHAFKIIHSNPAVIVRCQKSFFGHAAEFAVRGHMDKGIGLVTEFIAETGENLKFNFCDKQFFLCKMGDKI
jgi:hypothetical protein